MRGPQDLTEWVTELKWNRILLLVLAVLPVVAMILCVLMLIPFVPQPSLFLAR